MNPRHPYSPPSRPAMAPVSTPVFLSGLAAVAAGLGAGYADYLNVPVVAPLLDRATSHVFAWARFLQRLPEEAWFVASGAEAGLVVLLIGLVVSARFSGTDPDAKRMQAQFQRRSQKQTKAHDAGFNS